MEDELHPADAEPTAVAQQVAAGASSIYINTVHRSKVLDDPAAGLFVDAGMAARDGLPTGKFLGDDYVILQRLPDGATLWLQVEVAWPTGVRSAFQAGAGGRRCRRRWWQRC
jgi:hypothetical protein